MQNPPAILGICETWLNSIDAKCLNLTDYKVCASFGRKNKIRGGVALLINNNSGLKWKVVKVKSSENIFEVCSVKLEIENRAIQIILIYRPSNGDNNSSSNFTTFFEHLETLLEKTVGPEKEIILCGDLNIDLLKNTPNSSKLIEILSAYNFCLLNQKLPTRTHNNSATLLDHFFSNFSCNHNVSVEKVCFSDHDSVICEFEINYKCPKDQWIFCRSYSEENWNKFYQSLSTETWSDVYSGIDINKKSDSFMIKLIYLFNCAFPIKKKLIRGNQISRVDLSETTKILKIELRELDESLKATKNLAIKTRLKVQYKLKKKHLEACIKADVRMVNEKKINNASNKSRAAWNIVNKIQGKSNSNKQITTLVINDEKTSDLQMIADHLNNKFLEQSPDLINNEEADNVIDDCSFPFSLSSTSIPEILFVIANFQAKTSSSWDGISTKILKKISQYIAAPLCHLINNSFECGVFPDNLKTAVITPIYKKGEKCDPQNYRPIAVTSCISKIYEKIFLNRLEQHFEINSILSETQHGFRKKRSTVTALFDIVTEIYDCVENREKINLILYDFKNAFGCLVPEILIKKLKKYGLDNAALSWIHSFLTDRKQYVQLKSFDENNVQNIINSFVASSSMGVPQGTTLGPFGWTAYSNDFPLYIIIACLILFADDSSVIVRGKTSVEVNEKTKNVNDNVVQFADDNFLKLNAAKTNILQIHTHQTKIIVKPEVKINNHEIETCKESKLLGVFLSDTMNWHIQCDAVVKKLRSTTFLFVMLRDKISESMLRQVYFAYVQSHILYSIVIWGGSSHLQEVFVAQKRVIRAMAGVWLSKTPLQSEHYVSCRPLFKKFDILPVYSLYVFECIKFYKKYPEKFRLKRNVQNTCSYNTRNNISHDCDLYVPETTLDITKENPLVMIARIFNKLPLSLKGNVEREDFLKNVKAMLQANLFYDKSEYFGHKFDC
jgi:hypothetical protein